MADKPKNAAAVALGELGGKAKRPTKGFGSRRDALTKALETRRLNREKKKIEESLPPS